MDSLQAISKYLHPSYHHRHASLYAPYLSNYNLYILILPLFLLFNYLALGVQASDYAILYVILTPAGPAYPPSPSSTSISTSSKKPSWSFLAVGSTVRSWPGGAGGHKLGSNYAPTFLQQHMARNGGWTQILWLIGEKVTEASSMNFFIVLKRDDGSQGEMSIYSFTRNIARLWVFHPLIPLLYRPRCDHTPIGWDNSPRNHTGFLPCAPPRTSLFPFGTSESRSYTALAHIRAPSHDFGDIYLGTRGQGR